MADAVWLEGYDGQSTDELLALEKTHRIDSLVLAFEEALQLKEPEELNDQESVVLAVEALEREVNNGGYSQFFLNSSNEYAGIIVDALRKIGAESAAALTARAIAALGTSDLSSDKLDDVMAKDDEGRDEILGTCDETYFETVGDLSVPLFEFIKVNRYAVRLEP